MGKVAFSGPLYGAKTLLGCVRVENFGAQASSNSTIRAGALTVPLYEQWFLTEFDAYRGSTGSTAIICRLEVNSSGIGTVALTSSLVNAMGSTRLAIDAGEYEGQAINSYVGGSQAPASTASSFPVPAGTTLAFVVNSGADTSGTSSAVFMSVRGFIRYISSTRSEGGQV